MAFDFETLIQADAHWMKAWDDAMAPTIRSSNGDSFMIRSADTRVEDGRVYLVEHGGESVVRRLFTDASGGVRLVASNTDGGFPEVELTAAQAEAMKVVGRVVQRAGKV